MKKKIYGFGLVGCGMISATHAEVIERLENARLVGVTDRNPEAAAAFAEKHACRTFKSAEALFASEEVDVAVICVPSGAHAPLAVAALRAGCHVVIEKPLALTTADLDAIAEAERLSGKTVAVIYQQRFTPSAMALRLLISEGALGRLLYADLSMPYHRDPSYYEAAAWRGTRELDGGELFNQGVHGVDLLLYLCGDVTAVSGACRTLVHNIEAEDTTVAMLEFASGAVGTLRSSTATNPGYPRCLTLHFTEGTVAIDDDNIVLWDVKSVPRPEVKCYEGRESHSNPMAFSSDYHYAEYEELLEALDEGRAPAVSLAEGRRAPDVILAIYKSSDEGRRVLLSEV